MENWYNFKYVNFKEPQTSTIIEENTKTQKPKHKSFSKRQLKSYMNVDHIRAAMSYYFVMRGIYLTRGVLNSFVKELKDNHYEAFQRMVSEFYKWQNDLIIQEAFGDELPSVLKRIGRPSIEQYGLTYRFALLEEIISFYLHSEDLAKKFNGEIDKNLYDQMFETLQIDPKYKELSIQMRKAAAIADGKNPEEVIKSKGDDVQKFGCLFWIFC